MPDGGGEGIKRDTALPSSWSKAPLDTLGVWFGGGTPSKTEPRYWANGDIPWVSPKDMKVDHILKSEDAITREALNGSAVELVPPSSILMVVRSGILRHSFPVATNEVEVTLNQDMKALKPHDPIDADYIRYALTCLEDSILHSCSKDGTTVQSIQTAALKQIEIPLAPANEQRRIVAKIDELFSDIEEGERCLVRAEALLKQYRQSVLKAAVTGELTRDWRAKNKSKGESGADLLRRILAVRRAAWETAELAKMKAKGEKPKDNLWKSRYDEPAAPDTSGLPELPEGWAWTTVAATAAMAPRAIQSGPFGSALLHSEFQDEGTLVIGIDNVLHGQFSLGSQNRISKTKFEQLKRFAVRPKDVLITVMASIGRTCVVPENIEPAIVTKHVYRISVDENLIFPEFLELALRGDPLVRQQIFGEARGQTRPGLNGTIIKNFTIRLPPRSEQSEILRCTDDALETIERDMATIRSQKSRVDFLRQSILRAAFSGRLVAQDPADEPASALLARIAAERAQAPVGSRRARRR